jgi:SAM-dependent methyltransferase
LALLDEIAGRIQAEDRQVDDWFKRYSQQHRQRLATDLEIVSRHVEHNARILEYGAIPLLLTAALAALDYRIKAIDIKPERFASAIANLGLDVVGCDVETEPVPVADGEFDAVLFNELFEHLRINPLFTMSEVVRVLKPGGVLLLSTPNLRSFRGLRNLVMRNQGHAVSAGVYEQYEKLDTIGHMGHVREYTTREVADFLTRLGLRTDKIIYRGGHGKGFTGIAERLAPSMRPFFTLVATKVPLQDFASPPTVRTDRS